MIASLSEMGAPSEYEPETKKIITELTDEKILEIIIKYSNEKYYNSISVLDDYIYDSLVDKLSNLNPKITPFFFACLLFYIFFEVIF